MTSFNARANQWLSYDGVQGRGVYVSDAGLRFEGGVLDNKFHGKGVITWPDGIRYEGDFAAGQLTKGIMTWSNGQRFEGEFFAWQFSKGTLLHTNKDRYEGSFVAAKKSGAGVMTYATDGSRFEGDFLDDQPNRGARITATGQRTAVDMDVVNNKKSGKGVVMFANGMRQEGDFVAGVLSGKGIMTWPNGQRYEGDFVAGAASGRGIMTMQDASRYEGDYANGQRHGVGVLIWPEGIRYEGDFANGQPQGVGLMTWPGGQRYEGRFMAGQHAGRGKMTFSDGGVYIGDFVAGKKTGFGTTTSAKGHRYEGDYLNDQRHGNGVYMWSSGQRYEGQWAADAQEGFGIMSYANGDRFEGPWRSGEKLGKSQNEQQAVQQQAAQQQTERPQQSSSFQWGKALALMGGAALGGLGQLSSETQVKIIGGIARDSMAGQTGISGFQGATASSIADSQAQLMAARKVREQQAQAMALEAANNERLLKAARESRPVGQEQRQTLVQADFRTAQQAPATTQPQLNQIAQQLERDAAVQRTQNQESQGRGTAPNGSGQSPPEAADANISEPRPDFGGRIWMAVGGPARLAPNRASACQQAIGDREEQIAIEARSARFSGVERRSDCSCSYTARTKSWLCQVWYLPVGHAASGPGNR